MKRISKNIPARPPKIKRPKDWICLGGKLIQLPALLRREKFNLWDALCKFKESLLQDLAQEFSTLVEEGTMAAQCSLQMTWDVADSAARVVELAVVMRHSSWLQTAGLSQEMQTLIRDADLPFDGIGLFSEQTVARLHGLKDT